MLLLGCCRQDMGCMVDLGDKLAKVGNVVLEGMVDLVATEQEVNHHKSREAMMEVLYLRMKMVTEDLADQDTRTDKLQLGLAK